MRTLRNLCIVGAAALALASCSDEQTTFDIENVPGRATLKGVVNCNYGATYTGGKLEYEVKPVANLTVLLTIANSEYEAGLSGETVLEAVTNENGEYVFEVPVTSKGINAKISTAQFEGTRTVVERKNNQIATSEQNVVFGTTSPVNVSLSNYGIVFENVMCGVTSIDKDVDAYAFHANITGTIGRNAECYVEPGLTEKIGSLLQVHNGYVDYVFEPAASTDVIVYVNYSGADEYVFNATTNGSGVFTLDVPVTDFPAQFSYRVETLSSEASFTTYEQAEEPSEYLIEGGLYELYPMIPRTVKGYYVQTSWSVGAMQADFPIASYRESFELKALMFTPYPGEETYNYSTANWSSASPWLSELTSED